MRTRLITHQILTIELENVKELLWLSSTLSQKLVATGFLKSDHTMICDNKTVHITEENKNLMELLWNGTKILL